jgi:hypothetical protein
MRKLSEDLISKILFHHDAGLSYTQIRHQTGVSLASISRTVTEHRQNHQKPAGGRPKALTEGDIRFANRLIVSGRADTAVQVAKTLHDVTNRPLSDQTVRNGLRKSGLKAAVKADGPFISKRHRKARYEWAIAHHHWTMDDWRRVVWSDETKINRFGSDGRKWVWKRAGEGLNSRTTNPKLKYGGGHIMAWGCMKHGAGTGFIVKIDGTMDGALYRTILDEDLVGSIAHWGKNISDLIFQQDGDSKHRSHLATNWFKDHGVRVLHWPPNSPDMNPIEHLWGHLKRKLADCDRAPKGINELWERAAVEWDAIPLEVVNNLIESMPRRVEALYKAKGGPTRY